LVQYPTDTSWQNLYSNPMLFGFRAHILPLGYKVSLKGLEIAWWDSHCVLSGSQDFCNCLTAGSVVHLFAPSSLLHCTIQNWIKFYHLSQKLNQVLSFPHSVVSPFSRISLVLTGKQSKHSLSFVVCTHVHTYMPWGAHVTVRGHLPEAGSLSQWESESMLLGFPASILTHWATSPALTISHAVYFLAPTTLFTCLTTHTRAASSDSDFQHSAFVPLSLLRILLFKPWLWFCLFSPWSSVHASSPQRGLSWSLSLKWHFSVTLMCSYLNSLRRIYHWNHMLMWLVWFGLFLFCFVLLLVTSFIIKGSDKKFTPYGAHWYFC
jgi:hypothetical protein